MFKSVFLKIFVSGTAILLVVLAVTSSFLLSVTYDYVADREEAAAMTTAVEISELVQYRSAENDVLFARLLSSYASRLDATVFICNKSGTVIISSGITGGEMDGYVPVGYRLSKEQYGRVLSGKAINEHGDFDGYFKNDVVIAGLPLNIYGDISGGVFVCKALPEPAEIVGDMKNSFIMAALISFLFASLIVYITSKVITRPLKRMKEAAKAFSTGDFSVRSGISGGDEVSELAHEFDRMAESLENLEKSRRTFVADLSHELRTPMTTISGFAQGMLDGTVPPEARDRYLGIVLSETKRLSRLVNDILYAEKYSISETEIDKSVFDVNELIRLVLIGFESRLREKNISADVNFRFDVQNVFADHDSIQRVIANLVDNGIKFTPYGGKITVSAVENSAQCEIKVHNTGSFIEEKDRDSIFDRFYKTDKSRSGDKSGVGLGLHIVKSILALHKKSITVESAEAEGTSFLFCLDKA